MARLARLREAFLDDVDPQAALFCTYGLDAAFFEAEILPAVFPVRLNLDRESGSRAAYLAAADQVMQSCNVLVFFDHLLDDGPGLPYVATRVDVRPGAFHPKLIIAAYEDRFRVVISSANLTRPAWTTLLEMFVVEDLRRGEPHPWSAGLQAFLSRLDPFVPAPRTRDLVELRSGLASVPTSSGTTRVCSSWDGPLLTELIAGNATAARIDVVTPFFEGDAGSGVLDRLARLGTPKGRLYVSAQASDQGLEIRGPRDKIDELLTSNRWTLHRVAETWTDDDDAAPLRALHGKLLALRDRDRCRVMIGSANVTNAALLGTPPSGNVELVVLAEMSTSQLAQALPEATPLSRADVEIVDRGDPTGEDDDAASGPERWVESAIYWSERGAIDVRLSADAPKLAILYDGEELGVAGRGLTAFPLVLHEAFAIEVRDRDGVGVVPLVLADPASFAPRGQPSGIDFETFCELLAGSREPEMPPGELARKLSGELGEPEGLVPRRGAIPWRRILGAIDGLGGALSDEAPFPRGVEFTLRNPTKLDGFLRRLQAEVDHGRFEAADHAYALHEVRRMLSRTAAAMADYPESMDLVTLALTSVTEQFEALRGNASGVLAEQLRVLDEESLR